MQQWKAEELSYVPYHLALSQHRYLLALMNRSGRKEDWVWLRLLCPVLQQKAFIDRRGSPHTLPVIYSSSCTAATETTRCDDLCVELCVRFSKGDGAGPQRLGTSATATCAESH